MRTSDAKSTLIAAVDEIRGRPLACAVALFAVGIWAGARLSIPPACALGALAGTAVIGGALAIRWRPLAAALILVIAALAGGFAYSVSQVKRAGDVSTFDDTARTIEGVIVSEPRRFGDSQTMAVQATESVNLATGARSPAHGRVWLTCSSREPLERGDLIRFTTVIYTAKVPTNPGEITRAPALDAAGLSSLAYVRDERLIERLGAAEMGPIARAGIAFREHVSRILRESMPGPYPDALGALLGSIVFGAKADPPPPDVMEAFRRAGVVHVLVVSGTQISLLFAIVYAPGTLAGLYRRRRYGGAAPAVGRVAPPPTHATLAVVLALIAVYALFTEGGRPVARAAIMGSVVAIGLMLRQLARIADEHALEFDRYTVVAVAALVLLVAHPEGLFDIGLQLSLAAVLGLVYLGPRMARWLRWLPRWIALTIGATVSAQLAVLPIMASHFRYISPLGFAANLFVIPVSGFLLASGIAVCLLGSISTPLATLINYINAPLLLASVRFTYLVSNLPGASITVSAAPGWLAPLYYAGLIALTAAADRWWRRRHPDEELPAA